MKQYNKIVKILFFALIMTELFISITQPVYAIPFIQLKSGFGKAWQELFTEYKIQLAGFIGFGILTSILAFIINFMKLARYSNYSPTTRATIVRELIAIAITTALLGSVSIVMGLFYGLF